MKITVLKKAAEIAQFKIIVNSFGSKFTNLVDKWPIAQPIIHRIKYRYVKLVCKTNKSHKEKESKKLPEKNNQKMHIWMILSSLSLLKLEKFQS